MIEAEQEQNRETRIKQKTKEKEGTDSERAKKQVPVQLRGNERGKREQYLHPEEIREEIVKRRKYLWVWFNGERGERRRCLGATSRG